MQDQGEQAHKILVQFWQKIYAAREQNNCIKYSLQSLKTKTLADHFLIINKARLENKRKPNLSAIQSKQVFKEPTTSTSTTEFNFTQVPKLQKLLHLQFEELLLLDSQVAEEKHEREGLIHPILVNQSPIFNNHSLLVPYIWDTLPQVLGPDVLLAVLNVFKIMPGVSMAYNSLGAAASINHLHLHLFYAKDIRPNATKLPVETFPKEEWLATNEIAYPVKIYKISHKGTFAFLIRPQNSESTINFNEVLSEIFGLLIGELIERNMPHNILMADEGRSFYLFLRDFDDKIGWLEQCGGFVVGDEAEVKEEAEIIMKKESISTKGSKEFLENLQKFTESIKKSLTEK